MECEESGTHNEERTIEDVTEQPASPGIIREGAQQPQQLHRKPKVFTYERLGSPICYNLRTSPQPTHFTMFTHTTSHMVIRNESTGHVAPLNPENAHTLDS